MNRVNIHFPVPVAPPSQPKLGLGMQPKTGLGLGGTLGQPMASSSQEVPAPPVKPVSPPKRLGSRGLGLKSPLGQPLTHLVKTASPPKGLESKGLGLKSPLGQLSKPLSPPKSLGLGSPLSQTAAPSSSVFKTLSSPGLGSLSGSHQQLSLGRVEPLGKLTSPRLGSSSSFGTTSFIAGTS